MLHANPRKVACLVAVATIFSSPVLADDASLSSDKSQYTLFNPVPDDQMRSFSTDRPTKSDTPYTVDAGHFQYESDLVNWTYDHTNATHTTTSNILVADPTLKMGLTQNTDLEVALAPLNFNQSRVAGVNNTASGFGDVYTRVKFNLLGNDSGDYALAIVPYVKSPTAAHNVGNNHWEGGGYVPFVVALPADWTLGITSEVDILENAAQNGTHANFQNMITFGHPLFTPSVSGYAEFWNDVNDDTNTPTQYTADFALAWLANDNLQLDCGVNVGLNKASTDLQPYLGISQRF